MAVAGSAAICAENLVSSRCDGLRRDRRQRRQQQRRRAPPRTAPAARSRGSSRAVTNRPRKVSSSGMRWPISTIDADRRQQQQQPARPAAGPRASGSSAGNSSRDSGAAGARVLVRPGQLAIRAARPAEQVAPGRELQRALQRDVERRPAQQPRQPEPHPAVAQHPMLQRRHQQQEPHRPPAPAQLPRAGDSAAQHQPGPPGQPDPDPAPAAARPSRARSRAADQEQQRRATANSDLRQRRARAAGTAAAARRARSPRRRDRIRALLTQRRRSRHFARARIAGRAARSSRAAASRRREPLRPQPRPPPPASPRRADVGRQRRGSRPPPPPAGPGRHTAPPRRRPPAGRRAGEQTSAAPHAIASSATKPNGSAQRLGTTTIAARCIAASTASFGRCPRMTTPAAAAAGRSARRNGVSGTVGAEPVGADHLRPPARQRRQRPGAGCDEGVGALVAPRPARRTGSGSPRAVGAGGGTSMQLCSTTGGRAGAATPSSRRPRSQSDDVITSASRRSMRPRCAGRCGAAHRLRVVVQDQADRPAQPRQAAARPPAGCAPRSGAGPIRRTARATPAA